MGGAEGQQGSPGPAGGSGLEGSPVSCKCTVCYQKFHRIIGILSILIFYQNIYIWCERFYLCGV